MRQIISGGAVSKMYIRSFIRHCNAAVSLPGQGPLFPFSSCFALSDFRVLIRKCRLLNPLFSYATVACAAPTRALFYGVLHRKPEASVGSVSGLASTSCVDTMQQEVH